MLHRSHSTHLPEISHDFGEVFVVVLHPQCPRRMLQRGGMCRFERICLPFRLRRRRRLKKHFAIFCNLLYFYSPDCSSIVSNYPLTLAPICDKMFR